MALADAYVNVYGQLGDVFSRICQASAPDKFTTQLLKDWGYTSSNYRAVIPLLKALGFLSADGTPSTRYHEYRNGAQSKRVMAEALREAYGDLFTIKAKPTIADKDQIEGKFKSSHNATPLTSKLMASTFFALLELADLSTSAVTPNEGKAPAQPAIPKVEEPSSVSNGRASPSLHYNIEIHLPATKDIEVFNAIFKSLKEHLLD